MQTEHIRSVFGAYDTVKVKLIIFLSLEVVNSFQKSVSFSTTNAVFHIKRAREPHTEIYSVSGFRVSQAWTGEKHWAFFTRGQLSKALPQQG